MTLTSAGLTVLDNNYSTPQSDQASIGLAQQIGHAYALQVDFIHSKGKYEPMTPSVNFFEDPVTHFPLNPARNGRPYPAYTNITMTTSTGKAQYDGLQLGRHILAGVLAGAVAGATRRPFLESAATCRSRRRCARGAGRRARCAGRTPRSCGSPQPART